MARIAAAPVLVLLVLSASGSGGEEPVRITVVATCDIHGALSRGRYPWSGGEDVGGMDVLSGYLAVLEEENPGGVVAVDAGDLMQGTLVSGAYRGRPLTRALRKMGFAAVCLGNHEFDWGLGALRRRGRDVRLLGANVSRRDGRRARSWRPHRIVRRKGVRVGIVGVAHPDTPNLTAPSHVAPLEFGDPVEAVRAALEDVEAAGARLVVVLAHVGGKGGAFGELGALARALDPRRVHLIAGGHTHGRTAAVENGIPLLQAWPNGTAFGRVDLDLDPGTGAVSATFPEVRTTWAGAEGRPARYLGRDVVSKPGLSRHVRRWERRVEKARSRVVGEATAALVGDRRRESSLGDWVADVLRGADPPADFAVVNAGGLRADLEAGEITYGEVYEVMPFDNRLVRLRMTGEEICRMLEIGVSGEHGVVQVSGLGLRFDYDLAPGSRILGDVLDAGTGEPLDPDGRYVVAMPDFLADGGDGFDLLPGLPREESADLVRDLLVAWLREHRPFTPPDPLVERRLVATGTPP